MKQAPDQKRHVLSCVYFINVTTYVGARGETCSAVSRTRSSGLCSIAGGGPVCFHGIQVSVLIWDPGDFVICDR